MMEDAWCGQHSNLRYSLVMLSSNSCGHMCPACRFAIQRAHTLLNFQLEAETNLQLMVDDGLCALAARYLSFSLLRLICRSVRELT